MISVICDLDGCLNVNKKIFNESALGLCLAGKQWSDTDSSTINLIKKNNIDLIFLSGDERINRAYAKYKNVPFVKAPGYECKYDTLQKYLNSRSSDMSREYYYLGNSTEDYECLKNAQIAFIPKDASDLLVRKLKENKVEYIRLKKDGGNGVLEQVLIYLIEVGIINDFKY